MTTICGIFHRDGKRLFPEAVDGMLAALAHWDYDRAGSCLNRSCGMGNLLLYNTQESLGETLPYTDNLVKFTITADARVDNRPELFEDLGISTEEQQGMTDSRIILKSYQKWGVDCPKHLIGDFAFAIWDEKRETLFCARDHLGCKPLFYFLSDDLFIFATEMKGIFSVLGVPEEFNPVWIADSLTANVSDKEYTLYASIFRVPPAHSLIISKSCVSKHRFWQLDPKKEIVFKKDAEYSEAFNEKLIEAVRCRTRSIYPVGSELSGGLDSSAVAAIAAREAGNNSNKFITFSHVLPEFHKKETGARDEKYFGDQVCSYSGITRSCYITRPETGLLDLLSNHIRLHDGPSLQNFSLFSTGLYKEGGNQGIRTLLSGFGGDELVSSQAGGYYQELIYEKNWSSLYHELQAEAAGHSLLPAIKMAALAAKHSFPLLTDILNRFSKRERLRAGKLKNFATDSCFSAEMRIDETFLARKSYALQNAVRLRQLDRIMHPHVPDRMEQCSIAATARGIEYRYPLLDIRLLEFYLAAPLQQKRRDGYGRYLFRRAISNFVPDEIAWRADKSGATIPGIKTQLQNEYSKIRDLILTDMTRQTNSYIDPDKLLSWHERINGRDKSSLPPSRGAFMNTIKLLLFLSPTADSKRNEL